MTLKAIGEQIAAVIEDFATVDFDGGAVQATLQRREQVEVAVQVFEVGAHRLVERAQSIAPVETDALSRTSMVVVRGPQAANQCVKSFQNKHGLSIVYRGCR